MTRDQWLASLQAPAPPPNLSAPAEALWWEARGDWPRAHEIAQKSETADAAWVHAYLHRREGDTANAAYWYSRAGRPTCTGPIEDERGVIARALLPSD